MGLKFQPKPGMVLICDFRGFEPPEMVKRRPVVVLASNRRNQDLVTIVPLSTSPPRRRQIWHHVIAGPLEPLSTGRVIWAKCDMVYTISTARLHKIRLSDTEYARLRVSAADYTGIVRSVLLGWACRLPDQSLDSELMAWDRILAFPRRGL